MPSRLVILPTYNEAENIKVLIPRIFKYIEDCTVLVIDDGSPDGTAEIAQDLANTYPALEEINQVRSWCKCVANSLLSILRINNTCNACNTGYFS